MFNLEDHLKQWRQDLVSKDVLGIDQINELESHLREKVDKLLPNQTSEQAFHIALGQLGKTQTLMSEFQKNSQLENPDITIVKTFYCLFIVAPVSWIAFIWFVAFDQNHVRFVNHLDQVISLTASFSAIITILLLGLLSSYAVLIISQRSFSYSTFSRLLKRTTRFAQLAVLILVTLSWLLSLPLFSSQQVRGPETISYFITLHLPLSFITAASLIGISKIRLVTVNLARVNIAFAILVACLCYLNQTLRGDPLGFQLIPMTIITVLAFFFAISFLPKYRYV